MRRATPGQPVWPQQQEGKDPMPTSGSDPSLPRERTGAQQFGELVELQVSTKGFLTREAEHDLLEAGIRDFNLTLAEARGVVHAAAERSEAPTEREVARTMGQWLKTVGGKKGKISKSAFNQAVDVYVAHAGTEMTVADARTRVKQLMEEEKLVPRRAGMFLTRRWYRRI